MRDLRVGTDLRGRLSHMSKVSVQISVRSGTVRGPSGEYSPPDFIEFTLESHQRVVQIEWKRGHEYRRRRTVDWTWTATIETRL